VNYLRLKINLRTGIRTFEQPFTIKAGMPSSPTHFDGCRRVKCQHKCNVIKNEIIKRENLGPKK